jgi:hypothetical protein
MSGSPAGNQRADQRFSEGPRSPTAVTDGNDKFSNFELTPLLNP